MIKPRLQSRKNLIPTTTKTIDPAADTGVSTPTPAPGLAGTESGNATAGTANGNAETPPWTAKGKLGGAPEPGSEIQILELESYNPVISYQNEVYSCTWSDMIGTNMFFSEHDDNIEAEPLRATDDYDLLGTSRVKLIGRKAKLTSKPAKKGEHHNAAHDLDDAEMDLKDGKGFGSLRSSNPVINRERKRQARFLENLMDAKRAKGQTDNVRMVYHTSRVLRGEIGSTVTAPGGQASSQEIEELNRRVVRGDAAALKRLQMIYSEPEQQQTDNVVPQAPTPMPGST